MLRHGGFRVADDPFVAVWQVGLEATQDVGVVGAGGVCAEGGEGGGADACCRDGAGGKGGGVAAAVDAVEGVGCADEVGVGTCEGEFWFMVSILRGGEAGAWYVRDEPDTKPHVFPSCAV